MDGGKFFADSVQNEFAGSDSFGFAIVFDAFI